MIQEVDTNENIIINTILPLDEGFNYLKRDAPRLLDNYFVCVVARVLTGPTIAFIKIDRDTQTIPKRECLDSPGKFVTC